MKKQLSILSFIAAIFPLHALGYNVNFYLDAGINQNLFGAQVQSNKNVWEDTSNAFDYLNAGGLLTADIVFAENLSVEAGLGYSNINLHYTTNEDLQFSNGVVHINFAVIQLPIMFKYTIPLKKTTETVNSINVAAGVQVSYMFPNQTYTDSLTTFVGNFISPFINVGAIVKATYTPKIGPGKAIIGVKADINFLQNKYIISGRDVNIGNILTVSPMIGYSFTIKEDKGLSKITEKNKRIKDIDVR